MLSMQQQQQQQLVAAGGPPPRPQMAQQMAQANSAALQHAMFTYHQQMFMGAGFPQAAPMGPPRPVLPQQRSAPAYHGYAQQQQQHFHPGMALQHAMLHPGNMVATVQQQQQQQQHVSYYAHPRPYLAAPAAPPPPYAISSEAKPGMGDAMAAASSGLGSTFTAAGTAASAGGAAAGAAAPDYSRRDRSLGLLAENFMAYCDRAAKPAVDEGADGDDARFLVELDALAIALSAWGAPAAAAACDSARDEHPLSPCPALARGS